MSTLWYKGKVHKLHVTTTYKELTEQYSYGFHQGILYHHTSKVALKPHLKDNCVQMVVLMQGHQREDLVIECQKTDRSYLKLSKMENSFCAKYYLTSRLDRWKDSGFKGTQVEPNSLINVAH